MTGGEEGKTGGWREWTGPAVPLLLQLSIFAVGVGLFVTHRRNRAQRKKSVGVEGV